MMDWAWLRDRLKRRATTPTESLRNSRLQLIRACLAFGSGFARCLADQLSQAAMGTVPKERV